MFIKSIWMGFIGVMLFVANAFAARSVLQGNVEDAKGHPIQGANIRIEAKNTGRSTQLNFQLKQKRASVAVTKSSEQKRGQVIKLSAPNMASLQRDLVIASLFP